jgi:hypothetical protein
MHVCVCSYLKCKTIIIYVLILYSYKFGGFIQFLVLRNWKSMWQSDRIDFLSSVQLDDFQRVQSNTKTPPKKCLLIQKKKRMIIHNVINIINK